MNEVFETVKTIGSLVGLVTGVFVIVDRMLRHRPIVYLRREHPDQLRLVVRNTAKETIVLDSIKCNPPTMGVSLSGGVGDLMNAVGGEAFTTTTIASESEEVFTWITRSGWDKQAPADKAEIVVRWSFTSSRWLPRPAIRLKSTVERLNTLKKVQLRKQR